MKNKLEAFGLALAFLVVVLMILPRMLATAGYSLLVRGVVIAPLVGAAIFIVLMAHFEAGWVILLLLFCLDISVPVKGITAPALNLFYGFALAAHCFWLLQARGNLMRREMLDRYLVTYIAIAAGHYIANPALPSFGASEGTGFRGYFLFFTSVLPFIILPRMLSARALERTPYILLVIALVVIPIRVAVFFLAPEVFAGFFGGAYAIAPSTIRYVLVSQAATVLAISSAAILFAGKPSLPMRWVCMAATGIGLLGLAITGTRSLALSACLAILFLLVCARQWTLVGLLSATLVVAIIAIRLISPSTAGPGASIIRAFSFGGLLPSKYAGEEYLTGETFTWRLELWRLCFESILQHPWFGRGISAEFAESVRSMSAMFWTNSAYDYCVKQSLLDTGSTHNMWLGPFVTFGIPAGCLYTIYVVRRFTKLIRLAVSHAFPSHLAAMGSLLAAWAIFHLAGSLTSGGTAAPDIMILCALSHVMEIYGRNAHDTSAELVTSESILDPPPETDLSLRPADARP